MPLIDPQQYAEWIREYDAIGPREESILREQMRSFDRRPLISIIMPVYNPDTAHLRAALNSVLAQIYPDWELCIADDNSTDPQIRSLLESYRDRDRRIKIAFRPERGHIASASNTALEMAQGEFIALLDHDDVIPSHALCMVAMEINNCPHAGLLYSDFDYLDESGQRVQPFFKPDWNYDLLLGQNYLTHLTIIRHDVVRQIGSFRPGFDGSQDYDLFLRAIEVIHPAAIRHIPHILYHWRQVSSSVSRTGLKETAQAARKAIQDHLPRKGISAKVGGAPGAVIFHRVRRTLPVPPPMVSLISWPRMSKGNTFEQSEVVKSLTEYPDMECISVHRVDAVSLNQAVQRATSEILVFMDGDLVPENKNWLAELTGHVLREEIGLAGCRIVDASGRVRHGGLIFNPDGWADRLIIMEQGNPMSLPDSGYFARFALDRRVSGVGGGCLAIKKSLFTTIGGFDEKLVTDIARAVDLSLAVRHRGYGIVWSAHASLKYGPETHAIPSRLDPKDMEILKTKWPGAFDADPYLNPNLAAGDAGFSLAFPPRCRLT